MILDAPYPPQGQPGYPPQGQPGYPPQGQPGYPPQGPPGPSYGTPDRESLFRSIVQKYEISEEFGKRLQLLQGIS